MRRANPESFTVYVTGASQKGIDHEDATVLLSVIEVFGE